MNISFMVYLRYKKQQCGRENIWRIGNKMEIMGKQGHIRNILEFSGEPYFYDNVQSKKYVENF